MDALAHLKSSKQAASTTKKVWSVKGISPTALIQEVAASSAASSAAMVNERVCLGITSPLRLVWLIADGQER
jgi:hypothetical protein